MGIKYISLNKNKNLWKISSTKTGKSIKHFQTKNEAIDYAKNLKNIKKIYVKEDNAWIGIIIEKDNDKITKLKNSKINDIEKLDKDKDILNKKNVKNNKPDIEEEAITFELLDLVSRKTAAFLPFIGITILLVTITLLIVLPILWKI